MAAIDEVAPAWNDLVRAHEMPPTAASTWIRCFWDAFGNRDESLVVHSLHEDGRLAAVLPLHRKGGIVRRWTSVVNAHVPYVWLPAESLRPRAVDELLDRLIASADLIDLGPIHAAAPLQGALFEAARSRGLLVEQKDADGDTLIELVRPWETFRRSMSRNLEGGTARKLRQLERLGSLTFDVVSGGESLSGVLDECFRLETVGWKGERGSPILSRQDTLRFYTQLAHAAAPAGQLAVNTLRLDGELIAFEYCLRSRRRIDMLKISYRPDLGRYSPGYVLRYLTLRNEIESGEATSYHLGRPSEWKLHWATRVDPLVFLRIYGKGARGHLGYWTGSRMVSVLKKSDRIRAAVRWARKVRRNAPTATSR